MNTKTKAALATLLIALFACNAPIGVASLTTAVPSAVPPTPTQAPTPTAVPTPASIDAFVGRPLLLGGNSLAVTAVAVAPTTPDPTIYVGTWGGGVFRSRDHGETWTQVDSGPAQVTAMVVAPDDPTMVLVGTANMGVSSLKDHGQMMPMGSMNLVNADVRSVAIDPVRSARLFAGTMTGIYQSVDGGAWTHLGLADDEVDAITIDGAAGTIYAGTAQHGIQMTADDGASWSTFSLPAIGVSGLWADSASPSVLFAGTDGRGVARVAIGKSESSQSDLEPGPGPGSHPDLEGTAGVAVTGGPYGGTVTDLKLDPVTPTTLYAATQYGVFKTTDNGDHWQLTSQPPTDVYALAIDPVNPAVIYAGTRGQGLFRSLDGGETWARSDDPLIGDKIIYSLVVDPSAPNTIYAGGRQEGVDGSATGDWGGGVFKSINAGVTWSAVNQGLSEGWVYSLAIDPRSPGAVYAGTHSMGIYKSLDGGATWQNQSTGLVSRYHTSLDDLKIRSLAINPLDPDQLIAGTWAGGSVFATNDGGATWEYAGKGIEPTHVRSVAYNPANPGLVYAGQREGGLRYKQTSVADSVWQAFPEQVLGGWQDFSVILAIAISPKDGRTIFVGVEGAGVLRSLDGGVSWKIVDNGLLAVPVTAVEADGADASHLFASTYGAGVFQSLDSGVSWSRHTWATPWDWALGMAVDTAGSQLFVLTESNGLQSVPTGNPGRVP